MVNKSSLAKKLASYSAVATAILAVNRSADAQIIYTPVNPAFVGTDTTYLLDLNGDGIIDFKITQGGSASGFFNSGSTGNSSTNRGRNNAFIKMSGVGSNSFNVFSNQYGYAINSNMKNWIPNSVLSFSYESWIGHSIHGENNTWNYGDPGYLPLKFQVSGNTYYGWVRLQTKGSEIFTITGYAYNATPGATIYTGQECDLQYPKPLIQQNDTVLTTDASYKIQWYYNNKLLADDTLQSINATQYGIYSVVTGDTANCHGISLPFNYLNCSTYKLPTITSSGGIVCHPHSVLLTVDTIPQYYSVTWLKNDSITNIIDGQNFAPISGGDYKAVVYETGGCSDTSNIIHLKSGTMLSPVITQRHDTLFSNYTNGNLWSTGDTTTYIIPATAGLYNLCLTDSLVCTYCQDNFYYVNCDTFQPQLISNVKSICIPNPILITTNINIPSKYQINWYRNDTSYTSFSSSIVTSQPGKYTAIIEEPGGCVDTTHAIYIKADSLLLLHSPIISQHMDSLFSNYTMGNQWYQDYTALTGDTQQFFLPGQNADYHIIYTDSLGCQAYSNIIYFVSCETYSGSLLVNNPGTICIGDTTALSVSDTTLSTFKWNPITGLNADTGSFIVAYPTATTTYIITATTKVSGCSSTDSIIVTVDNCHYVWPGDANEDLVVNNYDLLPIGLYYNDTGPARDTTTNTWVPHIAPQWDSLQTNGMNRKFIDCNGDGIINSDDTLAVSINYGLTHPNDAPPHSPHSQSGAVPLYFVTDYPAYEPGSPVHVQVWLGNNANPDTAIYGIAYNIGFDASAIQSNTLSFTYDSSFIGVKNKNAITLTHFNNDVETAVVGADHTNKTGYGKIGDLYFTLSQTTSDTALHFSITNYEAIDALGNSLALFPVNDTVTVINTTTGIKNTPPSSETISIFPDPAKNQIIITSNQLPIQQIQIDNVLGQVIYRSPLGDLGIKHTIDISSLPAGMYFYKVTTSNSQIITGKFVKE